MDLLWMILLLFLVCAEAENVTEVKVELGQNVTLNCSGDKPDTYWYMEMCHSQVRGYIGRSYNDDPASSQFYIYTSVTKYSAFGNKLIITNITAEDCRLYFCGRKINNSIHFVETIRLFSDVPVTPSTNSSDVNDKKNDLVKYISLALNAFLILIIICLVAVILCLKKKKNSNNQVNDPSPVYENTDSLWRVQNK